MKVEKLLLFVATAALLAAPAGAADVKPADHGIFTPEAIHWAAAPDALPAGAKLAVLEGDPFKEGPFTMRLWMPAGYKIPPHSHPAPEHVTVVSGTFNVGLGDTFDKAKGNKLPAGTFAFLAPEMHHFAFTSKETVIQLHGLGPWQINYLNAADDPRNAKKH
ncbi:MAG TPA: cupin domain-containing protein [Thermoanaerobaculia bacterium]|nr:cupin domain-containing protein [Thermoanaerobaculia bacterium]